MISKSMLKALPSAAARFTGKFGWEKNYLSPGILFLLWAALAGLVLSAKSPFALKGKIAIATISMVYVLAFALTMYALWCPVGASELDNWQARYFTPLAPLLFALCCIGRCYKWRVGLGRFAFFAVIFGHLALFWAIWERYWA